MKDSKRRYDNRVAKGLCVICGKPAEGMNPRDPVTPCVTCQRCRPRAKGHRKARNRARQAVRRGTMRGDMSGQNKGLSAGGL